MQAESSFLVGAHGKVRPRYCLRKSDHDFTVSYAISDFRPECIVKPNISHLSCGPLSRSQPGAGKNLDQAMKCQQRTLGITALSQDGL